MSQATEDAWTWASLLAEPGGPGGLYDSIKRTILLQAEEPKEAGLSLSLAADVIASEAIRRGSQPALEFVRAIAPVFALEGEALAMFPDMHAALWAVSLASVEAVSLTVGMPLQLPESEV